MTAKININTATQKQLQKIPGIGSTLAQRIIDYRNKVDKFNSLEELPGERHRRSIPEIKPFSNYRTNC